MALCGAPGTEPDAGMALGRHEQRRQLRPLPSAAAEARCGTAAPDGRRQPYGGRQPGGWDDRGVSEQGTRRYPRTFGGLVASMIVLVIAVVAVVGITHWWGDANRSQANQELGLGQGADWVGTVRTVQNAEGEQGVRIKVVYPRRLPAGWYANTEPSFAPGSHPTWAMNFVKGTTSYVGIELAPGSERALVEKNVDPHPHQGPMVSLPTAVADRWTTWSDAGGDHAYSTTLNGSALLVWGPKDADLRTFLSLLTTKPIGGSSAS